MSASEVQFYYWWHFYC